ncbi:hypothetical protein F4819DRAFT_470215 [Hypoxylon fuscum]|nr:hypothetical protein F4819DRAFT_470215 [Hypoxylon fuscum]
MPSFAKIFTPLSCLAALAVAIPTNTARTTTEDTPVCPEPSTTARIWASDLYTLYPSSSIYPGKPDLASPSVQDLHIQYNNVTGLTIKQAAVFGKFPAQAKGCAFGWEQEDATDGILVAGGDGLLASRQLTGFPDTSNGVSASAVQPFDTAGSDKEFHADFTAWDREIRGTNHSSGPGKIDCSENIYLIIEKQAPTTGNVFLKKTQNAGIFIDYTC